MEIFGHSYQQAKRFVDGTHRSRSPEQTLAEYLPRMKQFGITRLADITGLDVIGLPVFTAIRPNARSLATSQGKGVSAAAAKASALMESIEGWHAEHIDVPLVSDSLRRMRRKGPVLNVERLPRYGQAVPEHLPMLWLKGWELVSRQPMWVPFDTASLDFTHEDPNPVFMRGSNGLSGGNHLLEAIVHGLCELIERDAQTLWALGTSADIHATQIDLKTVKDPLCLKLIDLLNRADIDVGLWNMGSETGVPCLAAAIGDRGERASWRPIGVHGGFGCHLSPEVAALRALTEAVQTRLTTIAGSRDDMFYGFYDSSGRRRNDDRITAVWSNTPSAEMPKRSLATETFENDVAVLLDAVKRVGVDSVVVCDLSKSDVGIPVVKVIAPGLEWRPSTKYAFGPRARARLEHIKKASRAA